MEEEQDGEDRERPRKGLNGMEENRMRRNEKECDGNRMGRIGKIEKMGKDGKDGKWIEEEQDGEDRERPRKGLNGMEENRMRRNKR